MPRFPSFVHSPRELLLALVLVLAASTLDVSEASAYCGTLNPVTTSGDIGSGTDVVVVGEIVNYQERLVNGQYLCVPTYVSEIGACIEHTPFGGGPGNFYTVTSCDTGTIASNNLRISTGDGNDYVAAAPPGTIVGCGNWDGHCWSHGVYGGQFQWPFAFGITADMGTGEDVAFGTDAADVFYSNQFGAVTADGQFDLLCGFGGNDSLIGDDDNSSSANECLFGGAGSDACYGEYVSPPFYDRGGFSDTSGATGDCESPATRPPTATSSDWCYYEASTCGQSYASHAPGVW